MVMSNDVKRDDGHPDSEPMLLRALTAYPSAKLRAYSNVPRVPLYIGGKFMESTTDSWIPVHNPVNLDLI